ncbi:hypothetical protein CYMTET_13383, partial [Cymbomonas tetramitiformis]
VANMVLQPKSAMKKTDVDQFALHYYLYLSHSDITASIFEDIVATFELHHNSNRGISCENPEVWVDPEDYPVWYSEQMARFVGSAYAGLEAGQKGATTTRLAQAAAYGVMKMPLDQLPDGQTLALDARIDIASTTAAAIAAQYAELAAGVHSMAIHHGRGITTHSIMSSTVQIWYLTYFFYWAVIDVEENIHHMDEAGYAGTRPDLRKELCDRHRWLQILTRQPTASPPGMGFDTNQVHQMEDKPEMEYAVAGVALGCAVAEVSVFSDDYFERFPEISSWLREAIRDNVKEMLEAFFPEFSYAFVFVEKNLMTMCGGGVAEAIKWLGSPPVMVGGFVSRAVTELDVVEPRSEEQAWGVFFAALSKCTDRFLIDLDAAYRKECEASLMQRDRGAAVLQGPACAYRVCDCRLGQGAESAKILETPHNSLEGCSAACMRTEGCFNFDFTEFRTYLPSACRLYGREEPNAIPNADGGTLTRQYCTTERVAVIQGEATIRTGEWKPFDYTYRGATWTMYHDRNKDKGQKRVKYVVPDAFWQHSSTFSCSLHLMYSQPPKKNQAGGFYTVERKVDDNVPYIVNSLSPPSAYVPSRVPIDLTQNQGIWVLLGDGYIMNAESNVELLTSWPGGADTKKYVVAGAVRFSCIEREEAGGATLDEEAGGDALELRKLLQDEANDTDASFPGEEAILEQGLLPPEVYSSGLVWESKLTTLGPTSLNETEMASLPALDGCDYNVQASAEINLETGVFHVQLALNFAYRTPASHPTPFVELSGSVELEYPCKTSASAAAALSLRMPDVGFGPLAVEDMQVNAMLHCGGGPVVISITGRMQRSFTFLGMSISDVRVKATAARGSNSSELEGQSSPSGLSWQGKLVGEVDAAVSLDAGAVDVRASGSSIIEVDFTVPSQGEASFTYFTTTTLTLSLAVDVASFHMLLMMSVSVASSDKSCGQEEYYGTTVEGSLELQFDGLTAEPLLSTVSGSEFCSTTFCPSEGDLSAGTLNVINLAGLITVEDLTTSVQYFCHDGTTVPADPATAPDLVVQAAVSSISLGGLDLTDVDIAVNGKKGFDGWEWLGHVSGRTSWGGLDLNVSVSFDTFRDVYEADLRVVWESGHEGAEGPHTYIAGDAHLKLPLSAWGDVRGAMDIKLTGLTFSPAMTAISGSVEFVADGDGNFEAAMLIGGADGAPSLTYSYGGTQLALGHFGLKALYCRTEASVGDGRACLLTEEGDPKLTVGLTADMSGFAMELGFHVPFDGVYTMSGAYGGTINIGEVVAMLQDNPVFEKVQSPFVPMSPFDGSQNPLAEARDVVINLMEHALLENPEIDLIVTSGSEPVVTMTATATLFGVKMPAGLILVFTGGQWQAIMSFMPPLDKADQMLEDLESELSSGRRRKLSSVGSVMLQLFGFVLKELGEVGAMELNYANNEIILPKVNIALKGFDGVNLDYLPEGLAFTLCASLQGPSSGPLQLLSSFVQAIADVPPFSELPQFQSTSGDDCFLQMFIEITGLYASCLDMRLDLGPSGFNFGIQGFSVTALSLIYCVDYDPLLVVPSSSFGFGVSMRAHLNGEQFLQLDG